MTEPRKPILEGTASGAGATEFFEEWVLIEAEIFHFEGRTADNSTTLEIVAGPLAPMWNDVERWGTEIRLQFHEVKNFVWNVSFSPLLAWDLLGLREDQEPDRVRTFVDQKFTKKRGHASAKLSVEHSGFVRFDFRSVDYLIQKIRRDA